jgi:hypothetical protein
VIDQPAAPPLPLPSPTGKGITLTNLRFPWDQLGALDVPTELPVAGRDVLLTLAVLAGQVKGVPTLVNLSKQGNLVVGSAPIQLGQTVSAGPNSTAHSQVALDTGAYGLIIDVIAGANLSNITITDLDNNRVVFNANPTGATTLILPQGATTNLDIAVTAGIGGTAAKVAVY